MITVITWKWARANGPAFGPDYVNRMRSMLERHLHLPHELVCITDDAQGIDRRVRIVQPPKEFADTPRCRRRMWHYARERRQDLGERLLCIDLDTVAVDDITPIVDRPEPIVLWRVGYARVYSGSFQLFNAGALDGAWQAFRRDPVGYPAQCGEKNASDQAMLNHYLRGRRVATWTERDGIVTWFGAGYEHLEHHGMGPRRHQPPKGARLIVLGSADKAVLDDARYPFVREHWV